ncbi:hypothetical protein JRO89_XS09G0055900 [Xanthoceras sorbifolium]|uniref:Uncharacterized protein n=1 Tax=Xanthoceras sorbifolium TaxID=99658 RepID=A0ABQ8HKK6_9ROSI|nr:hypothetical protein JRO89_XS09G0055900 [Xanthoceras sorbifolium]
MRSTCDRAPSLIEAVGGHRDSGARVLKELYFPHSPFLQAKIKYGSSLIWRSIIWGQELLSKGLHWRVGNGLPICAVQDKWLPRPSLFKVLALSSLPSFTLMVELQAVSGGWDQGLIRALFSPVDAKEILALSSLSSRVQDRLIWYYGNEGFFSVKYGY